MKVIFWQDTGAFQDNFLVSVGMKKKEILSYAKRTGACENTLTLIDDLEPEDFTKEVRVGMTLFEKKTKAVVLLYFPEFEDNWEKWETLMHETHHLVHYLSKKKGFEEEPEAQAYLQEYIFRAIRRKLTFHLKRKKKKAITKKRKK